MLRKMLVSIVVLLLSCQSLSAKMIHKGYSNHKYWKVYSLTPKNTKTALVCVITSKNQAFFLSYSGFQGWVLTFYYRNNIKLRSTTSTVKFYVDNKYIGSKKASINSKSKSVEIVLGLDTSILNPILKGQKLVTKLYKLRFATRLYGLKRAYIKSLGCWRERMDSIPYVANKTNRKQEQKKPKTRHTNMTRNHVIEHNSLSAVLGYLGFEHLDVRGSNVYFKGEENVGMGPVGFSISHLLQGYRFSPKELSNLLDDMVTKGMRSCNKFGVEKIKPFFTKNTVEVHTRIAVCALKDGGGLKYLFWALQSNKHVTTLHIITPIETFESDDKSNAELTELVSRVIE